MSLVWVPGTHIDQRALERMSRYGSRPLKAMGEAWFMGKERKHFPRLLDQTPEDLPWSECECVLIEMATGTLSFGPRDEWDEWFRYLLPRLLPRAMEPGCHCFPVELIVTTFITQHLQTIREIYAGFSEDVFSSLGVAVMDPRLWKDRRFLFDDDIPGSENMPKSYWGKVRSAVSANIFFVLKYLGEGDIGPWVDSIFSIASVSWRAMLLTWLFGTEPILTGRVTQPLELEHCEKYAGARGTDVTWDWYYILNEQHGGSTGIAFLPPENVKAFNEAVRRIITEEYFLNWISESRRLLQSEQELTGLGEAFLDRFFLSRPQ